MPSSQDYQSVTLQTLFLIKVIKNKYVLFDTGINLHFISLRSQKFLSNQAKLAESINASSKIKRFGNRNITFIQITPFQYDLPHSTYLPKSTRICSDLQKVNKFHDASGNSFSFNVSSLKMIYGLQYKQLSKAMSTISSIEIIDDSSQPSQDTQHIDDLQSLMYFFKKFPKLEHSPEKLTQLAISAFERFGINVNQYGYMDLTRSKQAVQFQLAAETVLVWFYTGHLYLGSARNKKQALQEMDGQGVLVCPNVSCYQGSFVKNKKNGRGIIVTAKGEKYEGLWKNDLFQGKGRLINQCSEYEGYFEKGLKQGLGLQLFANGDSYQGQYYDDKFEGRGKYIWKNRTYYEGEFMMGCMWGQGMWKSSKDSYQGEYYRNKKHGYGIYRWGNGKVYEGRFENGHRASKDRTKTATIVVQKQLSYDFDQDSEAEESEIYEIRSGLNSRSHVKRRYTIQTLDESPRRQTQRSQYSILKR